MDHGAIMNKSQVALLLSVLSLLIAALGLFGVAAQGAAIALILLCVAVIVLAS
jgi:uncharacterized membrane protein YtjA (UPF0391 family)